jgi:hypothetical protein
MRLVGEPIAQIGPSRNVLIESWLSKDSNERLKKAALEYLSACGETEDLPILKTEYEQRHYQTTAAAANAIVRINLRQSREKALRALIELQPEAIDEDLLEAIFGKPSSLETSLLLEGTTHRNGRVRARIVPILIARNALPTEVADKLLEDSEAKVRFDALRSLERSGREFSVETAKSVLVKPARGLSGLGGLLGYPSPPSDAEGERLWKQFQKAKLRSQPESSFSRSEQARTTLSTAERFALDFKLFRKRAPALRAAIDDLFQKEFENDLRALEELKMNADTLTKLKSIEESLRKEWVRDGLDILCEKSEQEDLERVRRIVSSGFVPVSAVDIEFFERHGEWQDIKLLVSLLDRSEGSTLLGGYFDDKKLDPIARAIYSIGKDRFPELCKQTMPSRLLWRVIGCASDKQITSLGDFEVTQLYYSEETDIRNAILQKSIKVLSKARLNKLLAIQMTQDRLRYYNVSYWLDLGISLSRKQVLHVLEAVKRKPTW